MSALHAPRPLWRRRPWWRILYGRACRWLETDTPAEVLMPVLFFTIAVATIIFIGARSSDVDRALLSDPRPLPAVYVGRPDPRPSWLNARPAVDMQTRGRSGG